MKCIKCCAEAGELSPEMRRAKERMGMPLTPPKVCHECIWDTLQNLKNDPATPEPSADSGNASKGEP